jgi:Holliday junction resolvase-like predicted endonuclease
MLQHISNRARIVIEQSTKTKYGEIDLITNANIRVKNLIEEAIKGIINDMDAQ